MKTNDKRYPNDIALTLLNDIIEQCTFNNVAILINKHNMQPIIARAYSSQNKEPQLTLINYVYWNSLTKYRTGKQIVKNHLFISLNTSNDKAIIKLLNELKQAYESNPEHVQAVERELITFAKPYTKEIQVTNQLV